MGIQTKAVLKSYFETGDCPTEAQFIDLIDSLLDAAENRTIAAQWILSHLKGYDTIGGFLYWEYDGVDGTARTVIPNGAGDVLYRIGGTGVIRASDGSGVAVFDIDCANGGAYDLYNGAAGILVLAVAADGSVTVQRTVGAGTFKVALWLIWL